MRSVLVTGGNRGVGLGLVRELLKEEWIGFVIATVRNVEAAKELKSIDNSKLHVIECDVIDEHSVTSAAGKAAEIVDGLDILINNAGIYPRAGRLSGAVSKATVMEQLEVNAVGPLLVANKFHSLLKRAGELRGSAQIVNISSASGSLQLAMENDDCDAIYSISKTALNMLTCKLALEWKADKIRAVAFTPGWVQTDMGGPEADLTIEDSTVPLTKRILALTEEHNASLYRITGEKIPW